ncbi:polygalacturonase [Vigna unguiculata]|uniref:Polygalacturonase n=1 Tax=Vigna unguiculata TaxID=3917 RepID=A0A4D6MTZ7_VIGUN|nr:polygalacturonase [Vigna unguiculata]
MRSLIICGLILAFVSPCICVVFNSTTNAYNVIDFGAKGNGKTDDSQAFLRAWESTCGAEEMGTLIIPSNYEFLLSPLILKGPCKASSVQIQIQGKLVAPAKKKWRSYYFTWILITNVNGLIVDGSEGSLHGSGSTWWSCKHCRRPSLYITNLNKCDELISIGSLGRGNAMTAEQIYVQNCSFTRTTNGARIKTFPNGPGYARAITFEQITLIKAGNPIVINQFYNDPSTWGEVEVSEITFRDFNGTSAYDKAITLNCDPQGCFNITLDQINIVSSKGGKRVYCSGRNVHGTATSTYPNCSCLSS